MISPSDNEVYEDRGQIYGDHLIMSTNLGRKFAATLSQFLGMIIPDIPPDIVELLMVDVKTCRAATPTGRGHLDSYLDGRVYLSMAEESAQKCQHQS